MGGERGRKRMRGRNQRVKHKEREKWTEIEMEKRDILEMLSDKCRMINRATQGRTMYTEWAGVCALVCV